ncbi:hypothetical protein Bca4012_074113 [Brassica carinata]
MSELQNINLILTAFLLSTCSLIRPTKLVHMVVDLLPTVLAMTSLSLFRSYNLGAYRKICCNPFPKCTSPLFIPYNRVFTCVKPRTDEYNIINRRPCPPFPTLFNRFFTWDGRSLSSKHMELFDTVFNKTKDSVLLTVEKVNKV